MSPVRLLACLVFAWVLLPPVAARADCAAEVGKLMSQDTERLTTRYNRLSARANGAAGGGRLAAERCRIARALEPRLVHQIASLRQSGCIKDPSVGSMVADIVRGHEDDLAAMRKATTADCK